MATITANTGAAGNWTAGTSWIGGVAPTAADDALIPLATTSITIDAGAVCRSANFNTFTGTITQGATGTLTIGDATAGLSNVALNIPSGATYAPHASSTITFISTSATQQTVSINSGYTCGNIIFNSASNGDYAIVTTGLTLATTSTLTLTKGTLVTGDGLTHSWGLFNSSNTNTRTLTLGNSNITCTGTGLQVFYIYQIAGLTLSANTATITLSGADARAVTGASKVYGGSLIFTGSGAAGIGVSSASTFTNLTRTGTGTTTDSFYFSSNFTVTGTLTINGNSATNRLLVYATTLGTPQTLTAAAVVLSNVDFCDITFAGTMTVTSASSIGDCGGNSGTNWSTIVTASATQNFTNVAGGNWDNVANWTGPTGPTTRVPLPQDDVTFDLGNPEAGGYNSGITITANMPRLGRSIDFSGAKAKSPGVLPTFALGNAVTNYGSLNLTGLKASGFSGANYWYFESQARSGTNTLTSNGQSFSSIIYIQAVGATLQLADSVTTASSFRTFNGTFVDAGYSITAVQFYSTSSATRAITKTGNWTFSLNIGDAFYLTSTVSWSDTAGTITFSSTSNTYKNFIGAGKTFNNLTIAGGGTGAIIFKENNVFTGTVLVNYPKTIQFADDSITTAATWIMSGATGAGNTVTIRPVTNDGTKHFHISKSGGGQAINDYLVVTNSVADQASTFYCGANGSADAFSLTNGWGISAATGNFFLMFQ